MLSLLLPALQLPLTCLRAAPTLPLAAASGSLPLLATLAGSLLLGIAYSTDLPLLRWKRSPVLAAACILAVRCACMLGLREGETCVRTCKCMHLLACMHSCQE